MVVKLTVQCYNSTPRRLSQWCTTRATPSKRARPPNNSMCNQQPHLGLPFVLNLAYCTPKRGIKRWRSIKSAMLKLNCEGVAGGVVSISPTAAGHKRNHQPLINVSASDVEWHSLFWILDHCQSSHGHISSYLAIYTVVFVNQVELVVRSLAEEPESG